MFKTLASLALLGAAALPAALSATVPATAQTAQPELYVVMFRADWCAPCKVVEPRLSNALRALGDPSIEPVMFDISHPSLGEVAAHRAFDREIVPQYNQWLGLTGFAAVIDATSKQTLGCVTMLYDEASMATHIRNLKTYAVRDAQSFDITCPEANNPL